MTLISEILEYNRTFVQEKKYEKFRTTKFPDKRLVILTCMDTRLVELLPHALGVRNGDVKIIKSAGAIVSHPFGSIMRSIIVAIYELGAQEVCVIGHYDCGMTNLNASSVLEKAKIHGIAPETINTIEYSGIDLKRWLIGFEHANDGILSSVSLIKNHPLLPKNVPVHGLIIHPETGKLDWIVNGYER